MCFFIFINCYILSAKLQKSFETKDDVFLPREGFCLHIPACYTVIELTKESFCPTRAQLLLFHFHYPGVAVSTLTQRWWPLQALCSSRSGQALSHGICDVKCLLPGVQWILLCGSSVISSNSYIFSKLLLSLLTLFLRIFRCDHCCQWNCFLTSFFKRRVSWFSVCLILTGSRMLDSSVVSQYLLSDVILCPFSFSTVFKYK